MALRMRWAFPFQRILTGYGLAAVIAGSSSVVVTCSKSGNMEQQAAVALPMTLDGFVALKWTVQAKPPADELAAYLRKNAPKLSKKNVADAIYLIAQAGRRELSVPLIDDVYSQLRGATSKGISVMKRRIESRYEDGSWPIQDDASLDRSRAAMQELSQIGYLDDK